MVVYYKTHACTESMQKICPILYCIIKPYSLRYLSDLSTIKRKKLGNLANNIAILTCIVRNIVLIQMDSV